MPPEPVENEQVTPQTTEQNQDSLKQAAFTAWEEQYNKQIKMTDDALDTWNDIFQRLADGEINEYGAYGELQDLEKQLRRIFSRDFTGDIESIEALSKEQRDLLEDAYDDMFTSVHFMQQAVKAALTALDNPSPGSAHKVKDNMDHAHSCAFDSLTKVATIKQELGLMETE
jgi:hypothetical protein